MSEVLKIWTLRAHIEIKHGFESWKVICTLIKSKNDAKKI